METPKNKKEILKIIETTLENIENYEDIIGGISIGSPILKIESALRKFLGSASVKGVRIDKDAKEIILKGAAFITEEISKGLKEHFEREKKYNEKELIEKVKQKANENEGFYTITSPDNEEEIKVAKIPFLIWACGETPFKHGKEVGNKLWDLKEELKEKWGEPISVSGEKLRNDDLYHSEWIRSIGVAPRDFYELVEEKTWIKSITVAFQIEFVGFVEDRMDNEDPINELLKINNVKDLDAEEFKMVNHYFNKNKKENKSNDKIKSLPYNINPNSKFPIYFSPILEKEGAILEEIVKTKCVVVENSDESVNEIALELSDYNNSIIFTRNPSKTAHLINISNDLKLNIFYIENDIKMYMDTIYKLEENGEIEIVAENDFSNPGVALTNCEDEKNWYGKEISKKVSNLAKCYNRGISVPNGFVREGDKASKILTKREMIARSAGISENSKKASFSGIFKSKKLDKNSIDFNKMNIEEVIKSFKSEIAFKYAKKMNVELPEPNVFYQEYIEADKSYVAKLNGKELYIETINGAAHGLVNGTAKNIEVIEIKDIRKDNSNLVKIIKEVSDILKNDVLEFEIIEKNNELYLVQVV